MPISVVSIDKAIKIRAYAIYRSARLIIDYSGDSNKQEFDLSLYQLNKHIKSFINLDNVDESHLRSFIGNICGIIIYHSASYGSRIKLSEAISQLSHAEHMYNWLFRKKILLPNVYSILSNDLKSNSSDSEKYIHVIQHIPLSKFNKSLQKEWLKVTNENENYPRWFTSLHDWEKNIVLDFIEVWKNKEKLLEENFKLASFNKLPKYTRSFLKRNVIQANRRGKLKDLDLGSFWGVQTGHLAHFPSVRNGYKVVTSLYSPSNSDHKLELIRKSSIVRTASPVVQIDNEREMLRITLSNIIQAILFEISNTIIKIYRHTKDENIFIPILIQNLAAHNRLYDDDKSKRVMQKAILHLREKFKTNKDAALFLKANAIQLLEEIEKDNSIANPKGLIQNIVGRERVTIDFCFSAHDITCNSFIKMQQFPFTTDRNEYSHLIKTIDIGLTGLISAGTKVQGKSLNDISKSKSNSKIKKHIKACKPIELYNEICKADNQATFTIPEIVVGIEAYKMYLKENNNSFLKAAYLIITFSSFGLRIGGCSNGCDIESPLTLVTTSLRMFFASYGHFPDMDNSDTEIDIFNKHVASELLKGYCHNSLEASSQGCSGLTYLELTLGQGVKNEIEKACGAHGISNKIDIYKNSEQISLLESACFIVKPEQISSQIDKILDRLETLNIDKTPTREQDTSIIELPRDLSDISSERYAAELELHKELKRNINDYFDLQSFDELIEEMVFANKLSSSSRKAPDSM